MVGMTWDSASSESMRPRITLMKSTLPVATRRRAISMPSVAESPSGSASSTTMRKPMMKSGPTVRRISSSAARLKRMRLSREPPKSSLRLLVSGDQNWSRKWP